MESMQTLTRSVAAQLGTMGLFMGGDRALFRLYANVPISCVETNRPPPENAEKDGGTLVDLLICKSCNDEAILGVIFGQNCWIDTAIFKANLEGLDHLFFNPDPEQTPDSITEIASGIYNYLQTKLSGADVWSSSPPEFALHTLPVESAAGKTSSESRNYLVRSRLILEDGTITAYGQDCGLIEQYGADDAGWQRRKLAIVKSKAKNIRELSQEKRPERKVSLAKRLARMNQQLPGDDVYGAHVTSALRQLLGTTLEKLCADDPDALTCLTEQLICASILLGTDAAVNPTYADALEVVYGLCREYVDSGSVRDELREHGEAVLRGLAGRLLALPTRTRLNEISEYPILILPVPHYFYAASVLDGSDYPNWFYKQQFLIDRDRSKNCLHYVALQVRQLLKQFLNSEDEDPFPMLYDLLVEPIFPGVRLAQSMI